MMTPQYLRFEPQGMVVYDYDPDTKMNLPRPVLAERVFRELELSCEIAPTTTLLDIFRAVAKFPELMHFLSQYALCQWVQEFHAEAEKEPEQEIAECLDYLEVYWYTCNYKDLLEATADFHGIQVNNEYPHCVSCRSMREIAKLPVKLNTKFTVYNSDAKPVLVVQRGFDCLEVLRAIYYEISFFGGP